MYNIKMVKRTKRTKKRTKQRGGRNNVGWYKNFNNIGGRSEIVRYDGCKQPAMKLPLDSTFLRASGVKASMLGGKRRDRRSRRTRKRRRRQSKKRRRTRRRSRN
jgi:hypothetical protein